jgi:integrase
MKGVLKRAGVEWVGWRGFRRGLASNLNQLGVDDSVIQAILRHSDVSVTQRCYIKTVPPDAVAAMRMLSATVTELKKRAEAREKRILTARRPTGSTSNSGPLGRFLTAP